MADFTVGTMGDFIGFSGYALSSHEIISILTYKRHLNTSTPFSLAEYDAIWKQPSYAPWGLTEYPDFKVGQFLSHNSLSLIPVFSLATSATPLANFPPSGLMTVQSLKSHTMAAMHPSSISLEIWRPSVYIQIGNASSLSLHPSKTVYENGNRPSWPS